MLVSLVDEVPGKHREVLGTMTAATPAITVRELIRARLELELERSQDKAAEPDTTSRPATPGATTTPRTPRNTPQANAARHKQPTQPETEALVAVALAGFEAGRFFVLVNDHQVAALDEVVPLANATEVTFLRLTPLQGG